MQSAVSIPATNPNSFNLSAESGKYLSRTSADELVLSSPVGISFTDTESRKIDFSDLYKSLTIASQKIVDRLNEILKNKLPNGLQSLKPEEVTPEASSDHVVRGVTALFDSFAKSNKDLSAEQLVEKFIEEAKKGVERGYGEARGILEELGALDIEGVNSGIEITKELILKKLDRFAELKLQELTGETVITEQAAELTSSGVLQIAGSRTLDLAA